MDSAVPGKPDPTGLVSLGDRLGAGAVAFAGDTLDDVQTAVNARQADDSCTYFGVGVLTGGLTGAAGRSAFEGHGADLVLEDVNALPEALKRR
jgi:phosphoglycolate phosphatase-like HAD superfamily hydrolase